MLRCLLGLLHRWRAVGVEHYLDTSFDSKGSPSTVVTQRCERCGNLKRTILWQAGYRTLAELNKPE
jgi:hypothetical protein